MRRLPCAKILPGLCVMVLLLFITEIPAEAATFDPAFYSSAYPDVSAVYGTDPQALLKHYIVYGMAEV